MTNQQNYKIAVVGLDLTEMDDHILNYLPILLKAIPLERVVFVHIAKQLELPEEIVKKYPDLIAPLDESIEKDLKAKIEPIFEGSDATFNVIVQEGQPLESFLKLTRIKNADLIIMGRKLSLKGSGVLAGDVVRKGQTTMLFITEKTKYKLNKLLIPTDFSRHTIKTLEVGKLIEQGIHAEMELLHLYEVPQGYSKTGKSYDEFSNIMKIHARADYVKFCKKNGLDPETSCEFLETGDESESKYIIKYAQKHDVDMILIGSRGRTNTSALLLGSMAEKVVFESSDIPIMVVKNKGESLGFFEALMKI